MSVIGMRKVAFNAVRTTLVMIGTFCRDNRRLWLIDIALYGSIRRLTLINYIYCFRTVLFACRE